MSIESTLVSPLRRAAFYIDGFNAYHGIAELRLPHLKWLDWRKLAGSIAASRGETLAKITFCTAPPSFRPDDVQRRHASYIQALQAHGVFVIPGFFKKEPCSCKKCGNTWDQPQEKQGDVNLAISLIGDAYANVYDTAYLVTADNDQAPTFQHLIDVFGPQSANHKKFAVVLPPNRTSRNLTALAGAKNVILMDRAMLEANLLPDKLSFTTTSGGQRNVSRPSEYDPPPPRRR